MRGFILVQSIKNIFVQADIRAVGIVTRHHVLPERDRETIRGFFRPGNLSHLQILFRTLIEDGAAEQKCEWNLTVPQRVEVFCTDDLEIICARNRHIDDNTTGEMWNHHVNVGPEEWA